MHNAATLKMSDASNSITLRTGVTMMVSTAAGYAFIENTSVDFSSYVGKKIRLTDSNGYVAEGWMKSQGTAEVLSSEIVTGYTQNDTTPYWTNHSLGKTYYETGSDAYDGHSMETKYCNINPAADDWVYQRLYASGALGKIFKYNYMTYYVYEPTYVAFKGTASCPTYGVDTFGQVSPTIWTNVTGYRAVNTSALYFILCTNGFWDNIGVKQVTQPSTSGIRIVSASGGTTYNWTSNTGIVANTNGTYDVTIFLV
jgi:hypothetical protein